MKRGVVGLLAVGPVENWYVGIFPCFDEKTISTFLVVNRNIYEKAVKVMNFFSNLHIPSISKPFII